MAMQGTGLRKTTLESKTPMNDDKGQEQSNGNKEKKRKR